MKTGSVVILAIALLGTAVGTAVFFYGNLRISASETTYVVPTYPVVALSRAGAPRRPAVRHQPLPEPLKAVYMTSCVAGTPSLRARLVALVKETEINAVVVDLKDYTGQLSFIPDNDDLKPYAASGCPLGDLRALAASLHTDDIYIIGRVTVFQDPAYAKKNPALAVKRKSDPTLLWADKKGINYIDPGAKPAWEHIAAIALDAYGQGVDELNFDYIRFPSDGNMQDISFPFSGSRSKAVVLEEFFSFLHKKLKPAGMIISADVFGMTTSSYTDVGIGQMWEATLPYFDYVAPMVYPSHYYNGFSGFADPNSHPYEVVKTALAEAVSRTMATTTPVATLRGRAIASTTPQLYTKSALAKEKIRPWLQDFDYPVPYTQAMVKAQIQAVYDLGLTSWMMWDPSNSYTREVYELEN